MSMVIVVFRVVITGVIAPAHKAAGMNVTTSHTRSGIVNGRGSDQFRPDVCSASMNFTESSDNGERVKKSLTDRSIVVPMKRSATMDN